MVDLGDFDCGIVTVTLLKITGRINGVASNYEGVKMEDRKSPNRHRYDDLGPDPVQGESIELPPNDPYHPFSRTKGEKARHRRHRR